MDTGGLQLGSLKPGTYRINTKVFTGIIKSISLFSRYVCTPPAICLNSLPEKDSAPGTGPI